jgi:hypothetical protein
MPVACWATRTGTGDPIAHLVPVAATQTHQGLLQAPISALAPPKWYPERPDHLDEAFKIPLRWTKVHVPPEATCCTLHIPRLDPAVGCINQVHHAKPFLQKTCMAQLHAANKHCVLPVNEASATGPLPADTTLAAGCRRQPGGERRVATPLLRSPTLPEPSACC